jgi:hypothetical protein
MVSSHLRRNYSIVAQVAGLAKSDHLELCPLCLLKWVTQAKACLCFQENEKGYTTESCWEWDADDADNTQMSADKDKRRREVDWITGSNRFGINDPV